MDASQYIIRAATERDAEGITFVNVKSWQTSYAGIIEQSFLDAISYEKRLAFRKEILASKNALHLVALLDETIVGFADAGPVRPELAEIFCQERGEIYAIYLLEQHKRKGIGRVLYKQCRDWFLQQGMETFVTWVLTNNHRARHFYEQEGGTLIGEKTALIGDKNYQEVCYMFTTSSP
jgi:GNAT superfamily N-acetyltransferase